jgi:hypothetical protein
METIYIEDIAKGDEIYYNIKLLGKFGLRPGYSLYKENL